MWWGEETEAVSSYEMNVEGRGRGRPKKRMVGYKGCYCVHMSCGRLRQMEV